MEQEMLECEVRVPIECLGNTAGELNRRGAIMENRRDVDSLQCFDAKIPAEEFEPFRKWLEAHTGGTGRVFQK